MMSATQNHTAATESALRRLSMRRSSLRSAGIAMPFASSRSLGQDIGPVGCVGHDGARHGSILQYLSQVTQAT